MRRAAMQVENVLKSPPMAERSRLRRPRYQDFFAHHIWPELGARARRVHRCVLLPAGAARGALPACASGLMAYKPQLALVPACAFVATLVWSRKAIATPADDTVARKMAPRFWALRFPATHD